MKRELTLEELLSDLDAIELSLFAGANPKLVIVLGDQLDEFRRLLRVALRAFEGGDIDRLSIALFELGMIAGRKEFHELKIGREKKREHLRQVGKANGVSVAEMRRQVKMWDKQLSGKPKKKAAMRSLGIVPATYYNYKRRLKKT